jgi:hypothetical protein
MGVKRVPLDRFPSLEELWAHYRAARGFTANQERVATQDCQAPCTLSSRAYGSTRLLPRSTPK